MRVVALEEHFTIPSLIQRINSRAIARRGFPPGFGAALERQLADIGAERIADMDDAGITMHVLSVAGTLSTLDVLVIGLIAIVIFETVLGILRTYLFSHTTNRIDVELGARLFRHLLALPISYFQARRVGDSVARVRELENIRTFPHQLGANAGDRSVFHVCVPGGDVSLLAAAHRNRPWRFSVLHSLIFHSVMPEVNAPV